MENSGQPWWFDFFINFSMKTLRWTFLLAMQSNRSAEFSILHSPALIPKFPQSLSGSYLFSHKKIKNEVGIMLYSIVAIALKLLPVFTQTNDLWHQGKIPERFWKSQSPSSSSLFSHKNNAKMFTLQIIIFLSQSPSGSYLFSHSCCF